MRGAFLLISLALLSNPAAAQKASDYVRDCETASDKPFCESSRKQFNAWFPKALKGDYQGQRNVAFCLMTGCDEAVNPDWITGCAWRMVLKAGRDRRYDAGDKMNFDVDCGAERVDTSERADAARIAQALFRRIYKRELPLDALSRP
ncbi:hypothetical protein [Bosea sp. F3-2]|uniref:hypothetical protein n=1 Tax=Bosea sp. F3-2 TaxID=2599640 RepID=UPI00165652E4|nr:hypothetical protein [Bosea sp. F3-2]